LAPVAFGHLLRTVTKGVANRSDFKVLAALDHLLDGGDVARATAAHADEPNPDALIGSKDTCAAYKGKDRRRGSEGCRLRRGSQESPAGKWPVAV
jgi:hypothetical protein